MSSIYKDAYLTIAATSAENHESGFLTDRKITQIPMEIPPGRRAPMGLQVREVVHSEASVYVPEPLDTKAWAFQERLISQRIIFFGSSEMSWECSSSTWTESGNASHRDVVGAASSRDLYHSTLCTTTGSLSSDSRTEDSARSKIYTWWCTTIVPAYTKLRLTKEEDKLPALSAIAATIQLNTKDIYLAGLWKSHLLLCLVWRSSSGGYWPEPGRLSSKYVAPSWSWASITTTAISGEKEVANKYVTMKVLDARCDVIGLNPTGKVQSGFIRLSSRWVPATMRISAVSGMSDERSFLYSFEGLPTWGNGLIFWPDVPLIQGQFSTVDGGSIESIQRSSLIPGYKRPSYSATVSCILIGKFSSRQFVFIVLGRSAKETGAFERLGLIRIHESYFYPGFYENMGIAEFLIV